MSEQYLDTNNNEVNTQPAYGQRQLSRHELDRFGWRAVIAYVVVIVFYVLNRWSPVLPADWHALSPGVLGGMIGAIEDIASRLNDNKKGTLSDWGGGPATDGHVAYYRNRHVQGAVSGFALAVVIDHFVPHASDAVLVVAGIVGGTSGTLLSTAAKAVNRYILREDEIAEAKRANKTRIVAAKASIAESKAARAQLKAQKEKS